MPLPPKLFQGDMELGKRDDDHKPGQRTPIGLAWKHRRPHVQRRSIKKIMLGLLVGIGLYYFYKNMPTDLKNPRQRPHYTQSGGAPARAGWKGTDGLKASSSQLNPNEDSKSAGDELTDVPEHDFNGPIGFHRLASTLYGMAKVKGSDLVNKNVVCP